MVFIVRSFKKRYCGAIVAVTTNRRAADTFIDKSRDEDPTVAFLIEEHKLLDKQE